MATETVKAGSIAEQKRQSNYNNYSDYSKTIHRLLFTEDLYLEPPLRKVLTYFRSNCKRNGLGVCYASIEAISKALIKEGHKASERTVRTGLKLGEEYGIILKNRAHNKDGYRGCDYKILASAEVIESFITDKIASKVASNIASNIASNVADRLIEPIPCESKDEGMKNEEHKVPIYNSFIKNQNIKPLESNIPIPIPSDSTYIDKEPIKEKDIFQTISDNIFHSTIPMPIKKYLAINIHLLIEKNFNVLEYERFFHEYKGINIKADYDDLNYLNLDHLQYLTSRILQEVTYIKNTFAIMSNWSDRHMKTRRLGDNPSLAKRQAWGFMKMVQEGEENRERKIINANEVPTRKPIRTEMLPDWFQDSEDYYKQFEPKA